MRGIVVCLLQVRPLVERFRNAGDCREARVSPPIPVFIRVLRRGRSAVHLILPAFASRKASQHVAVICLLRKTGPCRIEEIQSL